ncbi:MAG: hypothetical protein QOF71_496 [Candidatus Eremiobacteraeota bacterium]|jgi:hypothetical protein|nr:hypothetical protein [Candidatus Eremiobacteraeota bacterium]
MLNGHRKNSAVVTADDAADKSADPAESGVDPDFLAEIQSASGYVSAASSTAVAPPQEGERPAVLLQRFRRLAGS